MISLIRACSNATNLAYFVEGTVSSRAQLHLTE